MRRTGTSPSAASHPAVYALAAPGSNRWFQLPLTLSVKPAKKSDCSLSVSTVVLVHGERHQFKSSRTVLTQCAT